jgi:CRP/FNR family transcriptional regulator, anaerobic regulatory protein
MNSFGGFLISKHPMAEELSKQVLRRIKERQIAKGLRICWPGRECKAIYFVESGALRCYYTVGKKEVGARIFTEGMLCTVVESFFRQEQTNETIQAIEDSVLQYIDAGDWKRLNADYPDFRGINGWVLQQLYLELERHRRWELSHSAEDRYRWLQEYNPKLLLRLPLKQIAAHLGISAVMLSRIRRKQIS